MPLKVFHCADLHLDAPFSLFTPGEADRRRIELRSAFTSAVLFARSNGADIFIISGDLFDGDYVTRDTCELLARSVRLLSHLPLFHRAGQPRPV